jgi:adenylate cyclase
MFIVSENTKALAPEYTYRELDRVRVKGKDLPITIYEPIGLTADLSLDELDMLSRFEEALHEYRLQSWLSAQEKLQNLANLEPDRYIYPLYLERIEHYIANPPPENWDGVYTFTTK